MNCQENGFILNPNPHPLGRGCFRGHREGGREEEGRSKGAGREEGGMREEEEGRREREKGGQEGGLR